MPHADGCTAEELCQEIIGQGVAAVEIDRWYAGGWDGHICGLPFNDFTTERGKGYFVKAASAGVVTPTCMAPTTLVSLLAVPREASLPAREAQARVENVRTLTPALSLGGRGSMACSPLPGRERGQG